MIFFLITSALTYKIIQNIFELSDENDHNTLPLNAHLFIYNCSMWMNAADNNNDIFLNKN